MAELRMLAEGRLDGLVPELQLRGLARRTYGEERFRDNLLAY